MAGVGPPFLFPHQMYSPTTTRNDQAAAAPHEISMTTTTSPAPSRPSLPPVLLPHQIYHGSATTAPPPYFSPESNEAAAPPRHDGPAAATRRRAAAAPGRPSRTRSTMSLPGRRQVFRVGRLSQESNGDGAREGGATTATGATTTTRMDHHEVDGGRTTSPPEQPRWVALLLPHERVQRPATTTRPVTIPPPDFLFPQPGSGAAAGGGGGGWTNWYPNGGFGAVPASADAVAGLPSRTVSAADVEAEDDEEPCCAVCLEAYEVGDTVKQMPCAHGFHEGCIVEWLAVSRSCPLCRLMLPTQAEDGRGVPGGVRGGRPPRN